jgi:hypothetical protein
VIGRHADVLGRARLTFDLNSLRAELTFYHSHYPARSRFSSSEEMRPYRPRISSEDKPVEAERCCRKRGERFPNRDGKGSTGLSYPRAIAIALRGELGDTHQAVKSVMRWTGAGERSAKNWLGGTRGPTGEHLVSLIRHSDAVLDAVLRFAGREILIPQMRLREQRSELVKIIENIDELLTRSEALKH